MTTAPATLTPGAGLDRSAAASGTASANRSREGRWEMMLQMGRQPTSGADRQEFQRYLCRQLEATTINTMLQTARKASPDKGLLSGGFAGSMFQGLADEEYSRMLASRGGFGLGDQIYRQMASVQAARAYGNGAQGAPQKSDNQTGGGNVL